MKLTPKQKIFVDEYLVDLNATRAYKTAYPSIKKDETARANSSRLLTNANIKNYIDERMKDREKRTEITQDKVLNELAKIGFADIKDYLEYKTSKTVVDYDHETEEPIIDYRQIIDMKDSSEVDGRVIQEVSISAKGVFTFKLYDKMGALDKIARHLGMFNDKLEVSGSLDTGLNKLNSILEQLKEWLDEWRIPIIR